MEQAYVSTKGEKMTELSNSYNRDLNIQLEESGGWNN